MARIVLLSYLERNKRISIPEVKIEGDVTYLKGEFLKNFNFSKNVKLTITFQIFDPEWDEYVDLEEDSIINHKDKLKVVVSPCLTDPTSSRSQSSVCSSGPMEEVVELLYTATVVYLFILLGICP